MVAARENVRALPVRRTRNKGGMERTMLGMGALLLFVVLVSMKESVYNEYSGLLTAVRRIKGVKLDLRLYGAYIEPSRTEYAESLSIIRSSQHVHGVRRDALDLCPMVLATNRSSVFVSALPMVTSLASLIQHKSNFKHPITVIWKRGTSFDVIKDAPTKEAVSLATESKAFTAVVLEDSLKMQQSPLFAEGAMPDSKQTLLKRTVAKRSAFFLEAMRLCAERKCELCAIVEEGYVVSPKWPDNVRESVRTGGWEALVSYKDVDSVSAFEGWASEDVPFLIILVILLSALLVVLLGLLAFPDEAALTLFINRLPSIWSRCLLLCLVCLALMGRDLFTRCEGSVLERETQKDGIGFYVSPTAIFSGVTVLRTDPLVKDMLGPLTQTLLHTVGLKAIDELSIESKVVIPTPFHAEREYEKTDIIRMVRSYVEVIRRARVFVTGT